METHILRLDPPYQIIHCSGRIGLHVATLLLANPKETAPDKIGIREAYVTTQSYPIVSYGPKSLRGIAWDSYELKDCQFVCYEGETISLLAFTQMVREAGEAGTFLTEAMRIKAGLDQFGVKIAIPEMPLEVHLRHSWATDADAGADAPHDWDTCGTEAGDLYFEIDYNNHDAKKYAGSDEPHAAEDLPAVILGQIDQYRQLLGLESLLVRFTTDDPDFDNLVEFLNKAQSIDGQSN